MLSREEVAKHNSRKSCWIIVNDKIYDLTGYLDSHPGGSDILLKHAGKDATRIYEPIHPPGTLQETLDAEHQLGPVSPAQLSEPNSPQTQVPKPRVKSANFPLSLCLNLNDFETAAQRALSPRAWTYFHSAADGLGSERNNKDDWTKITFRPRVLLNVAEAKMRRSIMGFDSSMPFGIAPAALAKLAHPEGELGLARAAARHDIPYCVSTGASVSPINIEQCWRQQGKGGCLFFQLYINKIHLKTLELIAMARKRKFKVLVITVDTPVIGKREEDERYKVQNDIDTGFTPEGMDDTLNPHERPILRGYHSSTFTWRDLEWVKVAWGGPIVLKGIQTAEDAYLASQAGVQGIYLSNHGGRQCDDAPSAIRTLVEIRKFCPEILDKVEVWLDGGIRRGADVLKALCLGATFVFLGRPFMYALGAYGADGVSRAIQVLSDELETTMRLIGVTDLSQVHPGMVNSTKLDQEIPAVLRAFEGPLKSNL